MELFDQATAEFTVIALCLILAVGTAPLWGAKQGSPDRFVLNTEDPHGTIRIGTFRQLFLDDYLIEKLDGLERIYPPARKHPKNPLMVLELPSEGWGIHMDGTCLRDPETGLFRLWYIGWVGDLRKHMPGSDVYTINYAVSEDGIHWTKPKLGLKLWDGSRDNNLVQSCMEDPHVGICLSICYSPQDPDPSRRYKYMSLFRDYKPYAHFSPDGVHWQPYAKNPLKLERYDLATKSAGDRYTGHGQTIPTFWDPYTKQYVCAMRWESQELASEKAKRVLDGWWGTRAGGIAFSKDYINWSPVRPTVQPDEKDDAMVTVRLAVRAGSSMERPAKAGLAHLAAELLTGGTGS